MDSLPPTKFDVALARICVGCVVCNRARQRQAGPAFWFVSKVENGVCPFCRAYERVYGRKSHAPVGSAK